MDPFTQFRDEYDYAVSEGAVYMAYSSLGEQYPSMEHIGKNLVMQSPLLNSWAQKRHASVPALVLSWQLHLPKLVVIPRSTNPKHIAENARLLDPAYVTGMLSPEEVKRIDAMDYRYDVDDKATCDKMRDSGGCKAENEDLERCMATCYEVEW